MARVTRPGAPATLDDLGRLGPDELMEMYRGARTPRLEDLDGKLAGRMLAAPRIQKPQVKKFLDRFSRSKLFPCLGKTFMQETEGHGHDVNRLHDARVTWLRLHTA